ncbi:hypothetical protein Pfo_009648 [Paulownia fortunei]|nr:hypothetical protein Pfo_009648 [Paulownia fortunei]
MDKDPKTGGFNKFHGHHALRERARKIDQGILIIRFEMPFNVWCGGCVSMIAKCVRFNAEKSKWEIITLQRYYIWSFTMTSACCKHEIVIQTDPQNCGCVIISGARRKTEEYDAEDAETLVLPVDDDRSKLADPFKRLEHQHEDIKKKKEAEPKRVAEEEADFRKDAAAASHVKFATKFEKNRKRQEGTKKINAVSTSKLLVGEFKPSSWAHGAFPTGRFRV